MVESFICGGATLEALAKNGSTMHQFFIEINRPFKLNPQQQKYWREYALREGRWPQDNDTSEKYIRLSQNSKLNQIGMWECLGFASNILRKEEGETDTSKLKIISSTNILRNLAWRQGEHLGEMINFAGQLMEPNYPLLVREGAAGILKNSAYYGGLHIPKVIDYAITDWPESSERIVDECVRALDYVSSHSKNLMQNDSVKLFLQKATNCQNDFIAQNAKNTLTKILL
jgi:hypothetical protein